MTQTDSMAMKAIKIDGADSAKDPDAFLQLMTTAGLPCIPLEVGDGAMTAWLVLFKDGSAFFADTHEQKNCFMPWPLDDYIERGSNDELLNASDSTAVTSIFEAGAGIIEVIPEDDDAIDAVLKECLLQHHNPPESMRAFLVEDAHDFEWRDRGGAHEAQSIIVLLARNLLPQATELVIKADNRPGRTPAQDRSDRQLLSLMKTYGGSSSQARQFSTEVQYTGLAYAEIVETNPHVAYEELERVNEILAVISSKILERHGRPVGWSVDYNDGAHKRMSGFSAYADSIEVELSTVSNHQLVDIPRSIASYLSREGWLADYQELLEEFSFPPLPIPADA